MAWTEAQIADLKRLWTAGHSTSQIGTILGVSKNAVIGKAHRIKLPARPSPIRHSSGPKKPMPAMRPRLHASKGRQITGRLSSRPMLHL